MGTLSEALGRSQALELGGQTIIISPLNFADLADLEEAMEAEPLSPEEELVIAALTGAGTPGAASYSNPLSRLRPGKIAHQLLVLHLCLRKEQPGITRSEAAEFISIADYHKPETKTFLEELMFISGIVPRPELVEPEAEVAPAETDPAKKKRTRRTSTSG